MSANPGTRLYSNAELGVRFHIDGAFADAPRPAAAPELPGNVRAAYLVARRPNGEQAVLSVSRVEVGYDTSPHELAEQLVIHNHFAAHTAEQNGWTIHSPWKAGMLAGYPAMHCDYVVPAPVFEAGSASEPGSAGEAGSRGDATSPAEADPPAGPGSPLVASGGEAPAPGHVQAWIAYAGRQTFQVMLGVNPPGDLTRNRAAIDTVIRTFEIVAPTGEGAAAGGESMPDLPD